jgi:hypothetical protein
MTPTIILDTSTHRAALYDDTLVVYHATNDHLVTVPATQRGSYIADPDAWWQSPPVDLITDACCPRDEGTSLGKVIREVAEAKPHRLAILDAARPNEPARRKAFAGIRSRAVDDNDLRTVACVDLARDAFTSALEAVLWP